MGNTPSSRYQYRVPKVWSHWVGTKFQRLDISQDIMNLIISYRAEATKNLVVITDSSIRNFQRSGRVIEKHADINYEFITIHGKTAKNNQIIHRIMVEPSLCVISKSGELYYLFCNDYYREGDFKKLLTELNLPYGEVEETEGKPSAPPPPIQTY